MTQASKIILAVIGTAIIVGGGVYYWQSSKRAEPNITAPSTTQSAMKSYSSEKYSFEYPDGYKVDDSSEYVLYLTKEGNRKLVIFQAKDGHYGEGGIQLGAPQEQIDQDVPKKQLTVGSGENKYDVWIYYNKDDVTVKNELNAIFSSIKESPPTQQAEKQEARSLTDCSKLGSSWIQFLDDGTSLSFCYKDSWGTTKLKETEISPEAKVGTVYYISFSKSVNSLPLISYSTLDFQKLGDSDVPPIIDWKALDFSKSETELSLLFPNEKATVQKLTVNDKQVLKVNRDFITMSGPTTPLDYFMPNVVINETTYNLHIIGSPEQEADLNKLLESIAF